MRWRPWKSAAVASSGEDDRSIFSLDGLGLLGFEAALNRDYPVIFGTLYIFTLMGLILKLISDITYVLVDPRIDFESREGA